MFVPVFFRAVGQGVGRDGSGLREGLREKRESARGRGGGFFHGPSLKDFVFAWNGLFIPLGIL